MCAVVPPSQPGLPHRPPQWDEALATVGLHPPLSVPDAYSPKPSVRWFFCRVTHVVHSLFAAGHLQIAPSRFSFSPQGRSPFVWHFVRAVGFAFVFSGLESLKNWKKKPKVSKIKSPQRRQSVGLDFWVAGFYYWGLWPTSVPGLGF